MMTPIRKAGGLATLLSLSLAIASQSASAACTYKISNEWNTGLTGEIIVTNSGSSALSGWTIGWQYNTNRISSSWNATVSGSNPYTASNLSWNGTLQPGQSATFGFQVDKRGGTGEVPTITGSICSGTTPPASSSSVSSAPPLTTSSSRSSSSTPIVSGEQCNWYGTLYSLCANTQSGWGYENNKSCISRSTCAAQPAPFGIVGANSSTPSSSSTPATSSSRPSSSSVPATSSSRPSSSSVPATSSSVISTSTSRSSSSVAVTTSSSVVSTSTSRSSSSIATTSSRSSSSTPVIPGERLDNP
ncbi:cellulose binding domain-containing protein, partial [Cellvibrio mixtus]|uniref:cellulose binding domain-containing protein n=1 Tax=Cellvibrio mixtus TaxID=39650 RepID=UPI00058760A0